MSKPVAALRFSLSTFPVDVHAKDACALPWGFCLQPFGELPVLVDENDKPVPSAAGPQVLPADTIARCRKCTAYVNPYALFEHSHWTCPLCFTQNAFEANSRYSSLVTRQKLPELQKRSIEYELENDLLYEPQDTPISEAPIHFAVVDMSGDGTYLAAVQQALLALIEALPPNARFGLITYSDKVGIYNLRCRVPHVAYVAVPDEELDETKASLDAVFGKRELAPTLHELLPLVDGAAPIFSHEAQASSAVNALTTAAVGHSAVHRCLGAAVQLVLDYVAPPAELAPEQAELLNVRVTVFAAGGPNHGVGTGALRAMAGGQGAGDDDDDDKNVDLLRPLTHFYRTQAARAAEIGVTIDVLLVDGAAPSGAWHLPSIKFLANFTGGALRHYDARATSDALPQDVFRLINTPRAFHGLLRVRTGSDLRVANGYGAVLRAEQQHDEQLFLVQSCTAHDCAAFDLAFTNPVGFNSYGASAAVQVAFAYAVRVVEGKRCGVRRRLRVWTARVEVSDDRAALLAAADAEAVAHMLAAKAVRAALDRGLAHARRSLHDWLIVLLAYYNESRSRTDPDDRGVDAAFVQVCSLRATGAPADRRSQCPALRAVPRLVYALTRSRLLCWSDAAAGESARDGVTLAQAQLAGVPPDTLRCALYARMSAFSTPDKMIAPGVHLSRAAIHANAPSARIYIVDRYTNIDVFYTELACSEALPLPPPANAVVRHTLVQARRARPFVPRLRYLRADVPQEAAAFGALLVEEAGGDACSFGEFIDLVTREVVKLENSK